MASQPHHHQNPNADGLSQPAPEDQHLSNCIELTREQVLRRRSHHSEQLADCYRDYYWALMEDLRFRYREYVWNFGMSPFVDEGDDEEKADVEEEGMAEGNEELGPGDGGNKSFRCAYNGCKMKAMALTRFCRLHILSDSKQLLYKPCDYVIKGAQNGPLTCGKPGLRAVVPSLCNVHFQKAQQYLTRALRNAGLNVTSSNKVSPKLHLIVIEFVREIQGLRRTAALMKEILPKLESDH